MSSHQGSRGLEIYMQNLKIVSLAPVILSANTAQGHEPCLEGTFTHRCSLQRCLNN